MTEIFDIISAVNRLKEQVSVLNTRIDDLSKYPPLMALGGLMDEVVAAKYLHISYRELRRMRSKGEIPFKKVHRKILYEVDDIRAYLDKTKVQVCSRGSTV